MIRHGWVGEKTLPTALTRGLAWHKTGARWRNERKALGSGNVVSLDQGEKPWSMYTNEQGGFISQANRVVDTGKLVE